MRGLLKDSTRFRQPSLTFSSLFRDLFHGLFGGLLDHLFDGFLRGRFGLLSPLGGSFGGFGAALVAFLAFFCFLFARPLGRPPDARLALVGPWRLRVPRPAPPTDPL